MAKRRKPEITEADFYENLHNHRYDFPENHRNILQRMFVTAAAHLGQKEIRVNIEERNKYRKAKKECKLRGLTLQSVKTGAADYEYQAVIRPALLLRQANRFRIATGENSPAASTEF